ncbi:hypothetical protein BS47DRAFT_1364944 [Hydnum rufescens UP504]|uniref:Uncharacterized protein n=1 Tax=Hydnum rufescens UP504 TaxID=1448309 RepID=A0A9P6DPB0_9AGAM|nr:hypothetical protein BS47DRAFT_1364944 [Hydnum rufescens UP504]
MCYLLIDLGPLPARKPPHNATRSKNPRSRLSSGPNTRDPAERTWENNDPPAKRILRTATSRKPRCKPRTNPTPAEAGVVIFKVSILLNPHPPTEATTPPSENTRPWVRGNPNGEARNDVPGTTHPPKRYHTPARAGVWCY